MNVTLTLKKQLSKVKTKQCITHGMDAFFNLSEVKFLQDNV